jgi:hypothetical protein
MKTLLIRVALFAAATGVSLTAMQPVRAQTISMTGIIVNLCVLTVTTPGQLAVTGAGTDLSSSQTGGSAATLTVVATGTNPTITFSAPGITGPSASGATSEFAYSSSGGASRAFASSGYIYAMNRLLDTVSISGRANNPNGFASGLYTMSATATCAQ